MPGVIATVDRREGRDGSIGGNPRQDVFVAIQNRRSHRSANVWKSGWDFDCIDSGRAEKVMTKYRTTPGFKKQSGFLLAVDKGWQLTRYMIAEKFKLRWPRAERANLQVFHKGLERISLLSPNKSVHENRGRFDSSAAHRTTFFDEKFERINWKQRKRTRRKFAYQFGVYGTILGDAIRGL